MNRKGNVLVMVIVITAIAAVWLSGLLAISSNHYKINKDRLGHQQAEYLARSSLAEAHFYLQQALAEDRLSDYPAVFNQKSWQNEDGRQINTEAQWMISGDQLAISAKGQIGSAKAVAQAQYLLIKQPLVLNDSDGLTEVLWTKRDYQSIITTQPKRNYIFIAQPSSNLMLKTFPPIEGGLAIYPSASGYDDTLVITIAYPLKTEELLINGDVIIQAPIVSNYIQINGNVIMQNGSVQCGQMMIYGDLTLQSIASSSGNIFVQGKVNDEALVEAAGLIYSAINNDLPAIRQRLIPLTIEY